MATIAIKDVNLKSTKNTTSLLSRYNTFCESQKNARVLWYLIPLISLPAVFMPIGIIAVFYVASTSSYLTFVAFSMLALFANLISTIGGFSIRTTISVYFTTVFFQMLIPLVFLMLYLI